MVYLDSIFSILIKVSVMVHHLHHAVEASKETFNKDHISVTIQMQCIHTSVLEVVVLVRVGLCHVLETLLHLGV